MIKDVLNSQNLMKDESLNVVMVIISPIIVVEIMNLRLIQHKILLIQMLK
jgi:hypothetical protein